jgi:hypothetical protein
VVRSGHHAGAVGMDGGGQVVQQQLIGGSATSTDRPAPSQTFAAGLPKTTGCAPLKLAICFPTEKKTRLRVGSMSFLDEAEKQKRLGDVVESSDGMTLINVIAVGSTGFFYWNACNGDSGAGDSAWEVGEESKKECGMGRAEAGGQGGWQQGE